ncbi:L-serine ammonia-lyase, iron-sulfur-dependent, subunit alpha [Proteiniborus sp. MB09-C3]|uniref:L-cysteine desulfidase family protein n=1 Tax=Proteiniborus sp. MB09-C3 TaxID=3050072 RepID=UPI0025527EBC|nr:L-serine ammonia-lyase, iron-sulfur-dependent, subunit alpha [Proteiniborus sp. MB09-C3]WIV12618.1 L-serine ammonia-lyase, iron-sulfur-dependent, subunit alpha [Proteiniborus sp. MB09-C3]
MNIDKNTVNILLDMVKKDTIPAIGCTEPVAVAYASSIARKHLEGHIEHITVNVSLSIFKNGKSVMIPNTKEWGLDLAAALGAICGDPEDGLCIFKNINQEDIDRAHKMILKNAVRVSWALNTPDVYVEIIMKSADSTVEVVLKNSHDHIEAIRVNGELIYEDKIDNKEQTTTGFLENFSFKELREICEKVDINELSFIEDGIRMNKMAAEQGLKSKKGLGWGASLLILQKQGKLSADASQKARILTAAGADIRMGGGDCPIMTSAGSGNQGLGVILPIVVVAEEREIEKEKLYRAIFYAHIINKFVKQYTGKLSALCGCAIAAGVGASAAIAWMLGGDDNQIAGAVQNMMANLTGMLCDGAKETCALKLSTSAGEAVLAAYLACENVIAKANTGILGGTVEETIKNLGILCNKGLSTTNEVIVGIMS